MELNTGVLQGIANPMIADVGGAFKRGQEQRQGRQFDETAKAVISNTPGSKFADLMKLDPMRATQFADAFGIPKNETDRLKNAVGTIGLANKFLMGGTDPKDVGGYLLEQAQLLGEQGFATQQLEKSGNAFLSGDPQIIAQEQDAFAQLAAQFETAGGERAKTSAISERLPGGLIVQTDNQGNIIVTRANGQIVRGEEAQQAITAAEKLGSDQKFTEVSTQATARQRATRVSEIKKTYSERRRDAAREQIGLNQALKVVETADQGIQGQAKLQLSRIFTDIDVTNESQLDAALTGLSLDQLQKFKGPTTDFEFGVTQSISGNLGDSKSSNRARINSLSRANWFNQRESQQFNKFVADNKDPDEFAFNFGEKVKTKKGEYTLRQLQDTAVENNLTIDALLTRLNK